MGLTTNDILQQNTGSFEGTSGTVSLPVGTEAGSTILLIAGRGGSNVDGELRNLATPSGFTAVSALGDDINYSRTYMFIKPAASASETSWTLSVTGGSEQVCWALFEMTGVDCDFTDKVYLNAGPVAVGGSAVASQATNTTSTSETFEGLAVAGFFATNITPSAPAISGYTNGFTELASVSRSNATRAHQLGVAVKPAQAIGTFDTTASVSPDSYLSNWLIVLTGTTSRHAATVSTMCGFEFGTATNIATTGIGNVTGRIAPFDGVTGSPAVVTTTPRSGTYCLELSATSAAENVTWTTAGNLIGTIDVWSGRLNVYFPTSLPSGDLPLASVEAGSLANGVVIRYVSASQKIGVKIGTGTEVLSDTTVTANQWIGIHFEYDPRTTTHTCKWQVDYNSGTSDTTAPVAQTDASTSSMTAATVSTVRHGWTTTSTGTARYDDIVGSRYRKAYPIGDTRIIPLKVDPAGTPTVSGTSGNFRTFTNNGTLAAWTASAARDALDDIPPTIGASSDGLAQVSNAVNDYVEVPMETFTCAPNYVPLAGRWYWWPWAASGNPATFKFQPHDGSSPSFGIFGDQIDGGFDDTTLIGMGIIHNKDVQHNSFYQLTQTRIDALAARFGFSEDTNPDAGVHAVLFELAIQPVQTVNVFGEPGGTPRVEATIDPFSGGIQALNVYTPADNAATVRWYDSAGTPTTTNVPAASNPHTITVSATDIPAAPRVEMDPA